MARPFPQAWQAGEVDPGVLLESSFGASLMAPVDVYQKVTRSVKYGALFLLLPFLVFFLFEVLGGLRVHPLQYLLVGFAECLFYLLLLSLAEHLPFVAAYLAAAGAATLMVTLYASAVLHSWRRGCCSRPRSPRPTASSTPRCSPRTSRCSSARSASSSSSAW